MYKIIPNTNNAYSCDENGNIKSNKRLIISKTGNYYSKERILKPTINNKGYKYVDLRINNKTVRLLVHRIVAMTFIPNPNNYPQVNHKDCNPLNCNINNLEWCSNSYNQKYAYKKGNKPITEKQLKARKEKSTWLYKRIIQKNLKGIVLNEFESISAAAEYIAKTQNKKMLTVKSNISACCLGKAKTAYGYIWIPF